MNRWDDSYDFVVVGSGGASTGGDGGAVSSGTAALGTVFALGSARLGAGFVAF